MKRSHDNVKDSHNVSILSGSSVSPSSDAAKISASTNTSLMNGNGQIIYRRSPVQITHLQSNSLDISAGGPSAVSFNSEELSETLDSFDDQPDGDVSDLTKRFDSLQRQFEQLTVTQHTQEERYKRSRQENDVLLSKIHSLEDQIREIEHNSELRSKEDERRFKETMAKQMKVMSQECEQHLHSNFLLQQDLFKVKNDLLKSEVLIRTLKSEKQTLELELSEKNDELASLDEEAHKLRLMVKSLKDEESVKTNIISILNEELEDSQNRSLREPIQNMDHSVGLSSSQNFNQSPKLRSTSSRRSSVTSGFGDDFLASSSHGISNKTIKDIDGLETSLLKLREENKRLKETNEDLQAQLLNIQLEEGRSLLQEGNKSYSLADEMGDIDVQRLMKALEEQQDDNARLRKYMNEILLKVVDRNPEILDKTVADGNNSIKNSQISQVTQA